MGICINGGNQYSFGTAGIAVLLFDTGTHTCIDISMFLQSDEWKIVHCIA